MVWKEHKQSGPCPQLLGQIGSKRVQMDRDQSTSLKVSIRRVETPSDKALTDTENRCRLWRQDTQREKINCVFLTYLAFIRVCHERKNVPVHSPSPQRFICKCHTCQIFSICVSSRCHIFSENQWMQITKRMKYDIYFSFWLCFGHLQVQLKKKSGIRNTHRRTDEHRCCENLSATHRHRQHSVTSQPHLCLCLIKNVCLDDTALSLTDGDQVICLEKLL